MQIAGGVEMSSINTDALFIEHDGIPEGGCSDILEFESAEVELPLRTRCINSMPEIVIAALLNRLKPSISFVLDLMFQ